MPMIAMPLIVLQLAASLLAAPAVARKPAPGAAAARGQLVVFISIDQLRYQDVMLLSREFGPAGFAGLGQPGQLRYDTVVTETAADHATLSTGSWPELHGVVANKWLEDGKARQSIDDARCPLWGKPGDGRSSAALRAPTIGDALKVGTAGRARVVSVGNKDRVALLLAGPSADLALFWDDKSGGFVSTQCYASGPPPWVDALNAAHPLSSFRDYVWTPSRPLEQLGRYADLDAPDVLPLNGIGPRFPHPVGQGEVSPRLAIALRQTPAATTLALAAALAAAESLALGDQGQSDLLLLGIASVDGVGHQFGAHAPERIDTILRLHDELSGFVSWLRARYGERVAIVLSADHGITPIAAELRKLHLDVHALDREPMTGRLERALTEKLGPLAGGYVELFEPPQLWLRRTPGEADHQIHLAAEALRGEPDLWRVVETARLSASDVELAAAPSFVRHAIYPGRSSDLLLIARPLSIVKKGADGADHGSPWNDDALVPLFISAPGWSMRPQYRGGTVLATQVAPTLAQLLSIAPPSAAMEQPLLMREP